MSEEQEQSKPETMTLTKSERIMFQGIQSREREAERVILQPIREDLLEVLRSIHERLELPTGAIGTTHSLDVETWTVSLIPPSDAAKPQGPPADDEFEEASMGEASIDGEVLPISAAGAESNGAASKPTKHRR